jgi:hypothetical protein
MGGDLLPVRRRLSSRELSESKERRKAGRRRPPEAGSRSW